MSAPGRPPLRARTVYGRVDERAALRRLIDETGGGILALAGEAGIGKTRLTEWAADLARQHGRLVVEGRAHLGLPEPLGVYCDAVRWTRRMGIEPAPGDPLAAGFPDRLLPELGARAGDPATQGATFEAAVRYLASLAGDRGLLVILEDLHWADASSLTLTALLARALQPEPIALVATYRPDDDAGAAALERFRHELRRARGIELAIGPLAPDEAAAMIEELLGRRAAPDVEAELVRLAGGNPFALEELARAVVDSGWIDPQTGRRRGSGSVAVPWTLAESIRARSSRLAEPERELIRWAAVIGEQFDVRVLAAAAGIDGDDALARLAACVDAGLVEEDPSDPSGHRFAFRHALVHEALVQERLVAERSRRHTAVLDAAEGLAADGVEISPAELARHAEAAGDRRRTVLHSQAAAAQAHEVGAVEEAVAHLERALERWSDEDGPERRAALLLECGQLRVRLSRGDARAVTLLEQAREAALTLGDPQSAAVALALLADARFEVGEREQALADWERALRELRATGPAEAIPRALAGYARGLGLQTALAEARRAADEGLALLPAATNAEQARTRVSLLTTRGMVDLLEFRAEAGRGYLLDAARLAVEHQDDLGAARAHHILGSNFLTSPPAESIHHFARAAELVRRHGLQGLEAWYVALQAWATVGSGDWGGAARLIDEAEALLVDEDRAAWTRMTLRGCRADRALGLGDLDTAADELSRVVDEAGAIGSPAHVQGARASLGGLALLRGDAPAAAVQVEPVIALLQAEGTDAIGTMEVPHWMIVAEALTATGRYTEAAMVAGALRELVDGPWADAAEALSSVSEAPCAVAAGRIEAACQELEATGLRLEPARMRIAAAVVLTTQQDGPDAAAALVRAAHARFAELGSAAWCRRLEDRLRELGAAAPRRGGGGAGGLTRRELEVLRLLADGLTNRAIAERLVISEATAIRHVANIYAKLGTHNRAAAVRVAAERGLLVDAPEAEPGAEVT